jgi:hypothetical protein
MLFILVFSPYIFILEFFQGSPSKFSQHCHDHSCSKAQPIKIRLRRRRLPKIHLQGYECNKHSIVFATLEFIDQIYWDSCALLRARPALPPLAPAALLRIRQSQPSTTSDGLSEPVTAVEVPAPSSSQLAWLWAAGLGARQLIMHTCSHHSAPGAGAQSSRGFTQWRSIRAASTTAGYAEPPGDVTTDLINIFRGTAT